MVTEKDLLLLLYTYTRSSCTAGLLQHLQYYQRCEPIISKCEWKIIFFATTRLLWLLAQIKDNKIHVFWSTHFSFFFFNVLLLSILRNSVILVKDLIRWTRCFEIFLIKHCAGDIENKNIAGKYSKIPVSVSITLF